MPGGARLAGARPRLLLILPLTGTGRHVSSLATPAPPVISKGPRPMQALKVLVIFMAVLIVAGMALLVYGLVTRTGGEEGGSTGFLGEGRSGGEGSSGGAGSGGQADRKRTRLNSSH